LLVESEMLGDLVDGEEFVLPIRCHTN
jgi:hypothetical protein